MLFKKNIDVSKSLINIYNFQVQQFLPGPVANDVIPVHTSSGIHSCMAQAQLALWTL